MKKLIVVLSFIAMQLSAFGIDTLKVQSKITDVTVFFRGAQVTRTLELDAPKGKHLVIMDLLPAEINPQSIQVAGVDFCKILSVKQEVVFPSDAKKGKAETAIQDEIELQETKILEIRNKYSVYDLEENLLMGNSKFGKKDEGTTVSEIREAADFYRLRLNEIRQAKLSLSVETDKANKRIQELYGKMNELTASKSRSYSQVLITIDCEKVIKSSLTLRYYVPSAGWTPLYDFRVDDIAKPLNIVYNANVFQSTGESWNQVNVTLSSNNPSLSGNKPELVPWYLGRQDPYLQPQNLQGIGALKGRVLDGKTGEAIPFANIVVERNNQIVTGSITDFDGQFNIKPIAAGIYNLKVKYVGYQTVQMNGITIQPDRITFQNFSLNASNVQLNEVVVDYKAPLVDKSASIAGVSMTSQEIRKMPDRNSPSKIYVQADGNSDALYLSGGDFWKRANQDKNYATADEKEEGIVISNYISNSLKTNIANLEYLIEIPYTIPSDGEDYNIRIKDVSLPVRYVYHAVPKLEEDVFLSAEITNWNQLNLLSGKSNIYFQGTFTGSSYIDAEVASDTLSISLGRDRSILVSREGNKKLFDKKVMGSNVSETIAWDITVKNNKNTVINLVVEDQYPISEKKSIEVERLDHSDAKLDEKTGKLTWTLVLEPGAKRVITYKYAVKYPKSVNLSLE